MAVKKVQTVTLVAPGYEDGKEFGVQHAERLLRMGPGNGGWALPKDSKYYYDGKNGIRVKSDKADSAETV